jgi:hypothetical protein
MSARVAAALWAAFLLCGGGARPAPDVRLTVSDVHGVRRYPLDAREKKAIVLIFIAHDCPIANGYAPEINRICVEYARRGAAFFVVYVEPDLPAQEARKHARAFAYPCPALLDRAHTLVRRTGATVTPEAAVLAPDGRLRYRGRIDDRHVDFGKRRLQPTTRDLRLALDAVLQGKTVPTPVTRAVGCFIPPAASGTPDGNENAKTPKGGSTRASKGR